jgi:hypothetical protein
MKVVVLWGFEMIPNTNDTIPQQWSKGELPLGTIFSRCFFEPSGYQRITNDNNNAWQNLVTSHKYIKLYLI